MPPPDKLATVYANDEMVAMTCRSDFQTVCHKDFKIAYGTDGAIDSALPWRLTSAGFNFLGAGVAANMVMQLLAPTNFFKGSGELFAVEAVAAGYVDLRRIGQDTGVGYPPTGGATASGITFLVTTLSPQIEDVAFTLNEQFNVDPTIVNRRPEDIYDQRIFRRLTVLKVMARQYADLNREDRGDFAQKQRFYESEYRDALATATLRWGPRGQNQPESTIFGCRLER